MTLRDRAMKKLVTAFFLIALWVTAHGQSLAGYSISDYMVSAIHPNGCPDNYVIGLPDDSTWVNFSSNDRMTGQFGFSWKDNVGNELLLETSYHPDNYNVRMILSGGLFSLAHAVS